MTKKVEAKAGGTRTPGKIKKRSQFKSIWFRYRKNKLAMFGLILLLIIVAMTVFAPLFISYDAAIEQEISNKLQSPGAGHPFGTDMYGRDMFARVLYGGRISLSVGLGVVALSLFFGGDDRLGGRLLRRHPGQCPHADYGRIPSPSPASSWPSPL